MGTKFCIGLLALTALFYSCSEENLNSELTAPQNILPYSNDTLLTSSVRFEWRSFDNENQQMTFELHFGTEDAPPVVTNDITEEYSELYEIQTGTYYWYITASDGKNTVDGNISRVTVINPKDSPEIGPIFLVKSSKSEATVSCTSSQAIIMDRGFAWSRYPKPTKSDNKIFVSTQGNDFKSTLTELYDKTTYYVRSFMTTDLGTIYSKELSFESWDDGINSGTIVDSRDKNSYDYVRIGSQKWLTRNLAYLPEINNPLEGSIKDPYYYVYDFFKDEVSPQRTENYNVYGVLYNWPAAIQSSDPNGKKVKGVCPDGTHLPNDEEWTILTEFLGGHADAGGKLKEIGFEHWLEPNTGAKDEFGFKALPGGAVGPGLEPFEAIGTRGFWWSATELDDEFAKRRYLYNEYKDLGEFYQLKSIGFSVRCLLD